VKPRKITVFGTAFPIGRAVLGRLMKNLSLQGTKIEEKTLTYWFIRGLKIGEKLANRLLLFTTGRDPKSELKEPTKSRIL
jgi:hypothetical protein